MSLALATKGVLCPNGSLGLATKGVLCPLIEELKQFLSGSFRLLPAETAAALLVEQILGRPSAISIEPYLPSRLSGRPRRE